jgi:glutathione peroxidase
MAGATATEPAMPNIPERDEYGRLLRGRGAAAEFGEKESAEELERLGQARFGNRGRYYGGYRSEVDDRSLGGRDTRTSLADKIEPTITEDAMPTFFDFDVTGLAGESDFLRPLTGKVVLAVNVASRCGLTPQYADLEGLHEELADQDFAVVGFPCNQFGAQEPGSEKDIQAFCSTTYGVTFPMSEKLEVNGARRHPLYVWLTDPANGHPGDIEWNFEKFLIGRDGRLLNRYAPAVKPRDAGLMNDIAAAL